MAQKSTTTGWLLFKSAEKLSTVPSTGWPSRSGALQRPQLGDSVILSAGKRLSPLHDGQRVLIVDMVSPNRELNL